MNVVGRSATPRPGAWLVCNGDSIVLTDLRPLVEGWRSGRWAAAMVGVETKDAARFGTLDVGDDGTLRGFREKQPGAGLINAGVYLFPHVWTQEWSAQRPLSFEYDIFPSLLAQGRQVHVLQVRAPFLDIGTEASYSEAEAFIEANPLWFPRATHERARQR